MCKHGLGSLNRGVFGRLVWSHIPQMLSARPDIFPNSGEMHIGNLLLQTKCLHCRSNLGVMGVIYPGKEVMLNLVVQPSIHEAQEWSTYIWTRHNLKWKDTDN